MMRGVAERATQASARGSRRSTPFARSSTTSVGLAAQICGAAGLSLHPHYVRSASVSSPCLSAIVVVLLQLALLRIRFQEFADSLTRSAVRLCGLGHTEMTRAKSKLTAPVNLTKTRNPFNENVNSIS